MEDLLLVPLMFQADLSLEEQDPEVAQLIKNEKNPKAPCSSRSRATTSLALGPQRHVRWWQEVPLRLVAANERIFSCVTVYTGVGSRHHSSAKAGSTKTRTSLEARS